MAGRAHLAGAEVVLVDRSPPWGRRPPAKIGAWSTGSRGTWSHWEGIPALYDRSAALGGRVDILVNGAGIQYRCPAEDFRSGGSRS